MRIKTEIFKNLCLSTASFQSRKSKSKCYWDSVLVRAWAATIANNGSPVYELDINHGYDCKCCTRVPKESVTCPTAQEVIQRTHRPGRPKLRG